MLGFKGLMKSTFILLFITSMLIIPAFAEMSHEDEEWREVVCSDLENVLSASFLYGSTYGKKELCKNIHPEVVSDLDEVILELKTTHPTLFGFLETSPYLDGIIKNSKRSNDHIKKTSSQKDLKQYCTNAAKHLRSIFPSWGPKLEDGIAKLKQNPRQKTQFPQIAQWVDEVLLHDGRIIEATRKVLFHFSGKELSQSCSKSPDQYIIEVKHPDTGANIKWEGERNINPILIDFVRGIPYLAVTSRRVFSNVKLYGCPEVPYAFLKYDYKSEQWLPVPHTDVPNELSTANLSYRYDGAYMKGGKRQPNKFISDRYIVEARTSKNYLSNLIPKTFEEWKYDKKESFRSEHIANDCRKYGM